MKEGIYVRLVPITGTDSFYLYHDEVLYYLGTILGKPDIAIDDMNVNLGVVNIRV